MDYQKKKKMGSLPASCVVRTTMAATTTAAERERKRPETFFFFSLAPWLAQFPVGCRDLSQKDRACLKNEKAVLAGGKNFLLIQARKRTRSEVIHAYFAMQYRGKYFSRGIKKCKEFTRFSLRPPRNFFKRPVIKRDKYFSYFGCNLI